MSEVRPITEREFVLFRNLVESETGIHLSESRQALLGTRLLARIRQLGCTTFADYYDRVVRGGEDELVHLVNAICTNETRFFRDAAQCSLIEASLIPRWIDEAEHGMRPRRIRVWSAACSSGEEPYSVGMLLLDRLPPDWSIEILATDLSTKALAKAAAASYPLSRLTEIPVTLHQPYLYRGVQDEEGKFCIADAVRTLVEFKRLNLIGSSLPPLERFDLVLCRNVLMYFSGETRKKVVHRLVARLVRGGHICVGESESLEGMHLRLRTVVPTVYQVLDDSG